MYSYDIDHFRRIMEGHSLMAPRAIDDNSKGKLKELVSIISALKPGTKGSDRREIWFRVPNGNLADYTEKYRYLYDDDGEEEYSEEERKKQEEYAREDYETDYDEPYSWYHLIALTHTDRDGVPFYGVILNHTYVLAVNDPNVDDRNGQVDATEFLDALISGVKESMDLVKAGTYKEMLKEMPYKYRYGTISRKDYWDIFPDGREEFREGITGEEVTAFVNTALTEPTVKRALTARDFFMACATGYRAAGYRPKDDSPYQLFTDTKAEHFRYGKTTPREMYSWYADGRDDGLCTVPLDDPKAFEEWTKQKGEYYVFNGHHPYEIVGSGSLIYSIHLYPMKREDGWTLLLSSTKAGRSTEVVKMFLAMRRQGMPVELDHAEDIVARYTETDKIGILPCTYGYIGPYSHQSFPMVVSDVVMLPDKTDARYRKLCEKVEWMPEEVPELADK